MMKISDTKINKIKNIKTTILSVKTLKYPLTFRAYPPFFGVCTSHKWREYAYGVKIRQYRYNNTKYTIHNTDNGTDQTIAHNRGHG